jgi:hypothetical protein
MKGGKRFMKSKTNMIKVLGLVTTVIGMAASLLSDWVSEQKMNERIDEKVNEALAKRDEEENEES